MFGIGVVIPLNKEQCLDKSKSENIEKLFEMCLLAVVRNFYGLLITVWISEAFRILILISC